VRGSQPTVIDPKSAGDDEATHGSRSSSLNEEALVCEFDGLKAAVAGVRYRAQLGEPKRMKTEEYLEVTVDKFVFAVKTGYLYDEQGLWVAVEDRLGRVGVTDYLQQRSGDVAFVNLPEPETHVSEGEELGSIETIKADVAVKSPISGIIRERNEELDVEPELVNEDPYGEGWLVLVEMTDFERDRVKLMTAEQYLPVMKSRAEEEVRRR
jgi:glycine cleavage system H protein